MRKLGILIESNNGSSPNALLQALADQLTSDVEIIVFNDTSDSETDAIAAQQQNGSIRVVNRDRSSISTSQNTDTDFCDSEYIWFVNPTITVVDNVVAQLLELIKRQPSDCYTLGFQQEEQRQDKNISSTTIRYDTKECISNSCNQVFTDAVLLESSNKVFSHAAIARSSASHFPGHTSMSNAIFTLQILAYANNLCISDAIFYYSTDRHSTSVSQTAQQDYLHECVQLIDEFNRFCTRTGVKAPDLHSSLVKFFYEHFYQSIYNALPKQKTYQLFKRNAKTHITEYEAILQGIGVFRGELPSPFKAYISLRWKTCRTNAKATLHEIRINPGLLPKLLVFILRFGMWTERIPYRLIALPFKLMDRIIDLLYCKLLLNCDIPSALSLGRNVIFYHPYGIFINAEAVIGSNFICRGQVTIGNKGEGELGAGCPMIGDHVEVGVGAKIIGPISIGDHCAIGANAVVTKSFPPHRTLVGIPARAL